MSLRATTTLTGAPVYVPFAYQVSDLYGALIARVWALGYYESGGA